MLCPVISTHLLAFWIFKLYHNVFIQLMELVQVSSHGPVWLFSQIALGSGVSGSVHISFVLIPTTETNPQTAPTLHFTSSYKELHVKHSIHQSSDGCFFCKLSPSLWQHMFCTLSRVVPILFLNNQECHFSTSWGRLCNKNLSPGQN